MVRDSFPIILLALVFSACGEPAWIDAKGTVEVSPGELGFETIAVGWETAGELELVNRRDVSVRVSLETAPQGFRVLPFTSSLGPGARVLVGVRFAPSSVGVFEGELRFRVSGAGGSFLVIPVRGVGVAEPFGVQGVVEFGPVALGSEKRSEVVIQNLTDLSMDLDLGLEGHDPGAFTLGAHALHLPANGRQQVEIRFEPKVASRPEWAFLSLQCKGCRKRQVQLLGQGSLGKLLVVPGHVDMGASRPGEPKAQEVLVQNVGNVGVTVEGLSLSAGSHRDFSLHEKTLPVFLSPGGTLHVTLEFHPSEPHGERQGELQVVGSLESSLDVSVFGWSGGPELVASPASMDLGTAPVRWLSGGGPPPGERRKIEIHNAGRSPRTSVEFEVRGKGRRSFEVLPLRGLELNPDSSLEFEVWFNPQSEGFHLAEVVFGADEASVVVPLSGWGSRPSPRCPEAIVARADGLIKLSGADDSPLATTCSWTITHRPEGSSAEIVEGTDCKASFEPDLVGEYVATLDVVDQGGNIGSCSTSVSAIAGADLWIESYWNRRSDVDLHLVNKDLADPTLPDTWGSSADCHFYNCVAGAKGYLDWQADETSTPVLDQDDTSATGPENIRIDVPSQDHGYSVGLHWYQGGAQQSVDVVTKIYCYGLLSKTITRTLDSPKLFVVLGDLEFQEEGCTFKDANLEWEDF